MAVKCTKLDRSGRARIADFCHRLLRLASQQDKHVAPATAAERAERLAQAVVDRLAAVAGGQENAR